MKHTLLRLIFLFAAVCTFSSCATLFGGPVSACQRTKPASGEPSRQVRVAALIADIILFPPSVIVDFATNAIYVPCNASPKERLPDQ